MKTYAVYFRPRGANYAFSRNTVVMVSASSKKEAREEAVMRMGDCYKVVKCIEID